MELKFNHPGPGQFVTMPAMMDFGYEKGQTFEISVHRIEWDEWSMSAKTDILPVNAETGEYLDKPMITVDLDLWDYSVV